VQYCLGLNTRRGLGDDRERVISWSAQRQSRQRRGVPRNYQVTERLAPSCAAEPYCTTGSNNA
jgi:hypothetical protein